MKTYSADVWKWIAGGLLTALLSSFATYRAAAGDFATRAEMHEALRPDREVIRETRDDVKRLIEKLDELNQRVAKLEGRLEPGR